jgi:hypothetical protein
MRAVLVSVVALSLLTGPAGLRAADDGQADRAANVPKEVRALEGSFVGTWNMYGIDDKGDVIKRFTWTDTIKSTGVEVKNDRAYIKWVNEQTFAGRPGPPRKTEGKEGYFLNKDGTLGDYFIEMFGMSTRMRQLSETAWSYATPAFPQELTVLGFPKTASGQHVVVKVVTKENNLETHRISRVSTVRWKDKEGKDRVIQFVSLQGHHQREP